MEIPPFAQLSLAIDTLKVEGKAPIRWRQVIEVKLVGYGTKFMIARLQFTGISARPLVTKFDHAVVFGASKSRMFRGTNDSRNQMCTNISKLSRILLGYSLERYGNRPEHLMG